MFRKSNFTTPLCNIKKRLHYATTLEKRESGQIALPFCKIVSNAMEKFVRHFRFFHNSRIYPTNFLPLQMYIEEKEGKKIRHVSTALDANPGIKAK